ncbi:hypothetical protein YC2023_002262 [Brassica napus]
MSSGLRLSQVKQLVRSKGQLKMQPAEMICISSQSTTGATTDVAPCSKSMKSGRGPGDVGS